MLLVSSSWYRDRWIVLGGDMEPGEELGLWQSEVYGEVGVKGKLG